MLHQNLYNDFCVATGCYPDREEFDIAMEQEIDAGFTRPVLLIDAFHNQYHEINAKNVLNIRGSILWAQLLNTH